uniref:F-box protein At5g50450 n=1 Tax=Erigeron canadensis TaxID=72917 RepID=UPI001CB8ADEF|nr:F-box protein At5g50450 [Erigeron canadensis]
MRKKLRGRSAGGTIGSDVFDSLPDDLVISILCKLSSTASSPSELIVVLLTCKRLNKLGLDPLVLSKACSKTLSIRANKWCDGAHRFLKLCVKAGNIEAYYTLGMIRFYCLESRGNGASLIARAAIKSHALAFYSLALIQFNGSGALKNDDKDLRAGVALCARSAYLGHVDALRELGHCLQDGYGVQKNITEGRRLLVQANVRELASPLQIFNKTQPRPMVKNKTDFNNYDLFTDYGFHLTGQEIHPANNFMVEWFGSREDSTLGPQGLKMCSYKGCGRPETRKNEFRTCSGCGKVKYCSRGCQAHDWRVCHKVDCAPMEEWVGHAINDLADEEDIINDDNVAIDDQTNETRQEAVEEILV